MSIYKTICENITNEGRLQRGYELPSKKAAPNELNWMVGAMDGVGFFHMGQKQNE